MIKRWYYFIFLWAILWSCGDKQWKGQEPIQRVSTETRPIQYQWKKTYHIGKGLHFSNEFDGARLNGIAMTGEEQVTVLITPENTPINSSPWYAFKVWSDTPRNIRIKITYNEGVSHRYYPKYSQDCKTWAKIDSASYLLDSVSVAHKEAPKFCEFDLSVSPDTTWIAAQELIVSKDIDRWEAQLEPLPFVTLQEIGKSRSGKPISMLQIGNPESKKLVMILSRQHPPEVSGWLAMKAFVERLCVTDSLTQNFRNEYLTCVVPCMNPDGVDLGHWRHNAGGIDLNRDWEAFRQPETQLIRRFMQDKVIKGAKFYIAIDFHSTFEDIYYTISPRLKGNMPGVVPQIIAASAKQIPGYVPNIRPNDKDAPHISSSESIFNAFHAEAFTYEVGDDTPRNLIQKKGEATAVSMVQHLLK
ncbi:M14 family metallopeptidase [Maribellus sp. YY47]|uniref:M14 family metallopeptidase n=1 Tax=Maribellus sp. YY47 TaxID=2929486 RepID=UPI00200174A4|nr:M14 family metallopeptidase [Maribellus sp. YY47]MCK3685057.1 M14 family metallopeptidase [Maribellus sp. YY47]